MYDPTHDDEAPELTPDLVLTALIVVGLIFIALIGLNVLTP